MFHYFPSTLPIFWLFENRNLYMSCSLAAIFIRGDAFLEKKPVEQEGGHFSSPPYSFYTTSNKLLFITEIYKTKRKFLKRTVLDFLELVLTNS